MDTKSTPTHARKIRPVGIVYANMPAFTCVWRSITYYLYISVFWIINLTPLKCFPLFVLSISVYNEFIYCSTKKRFTLGDLNSPYIAYSLFARSSNPCEVWLFRHLKKQISICDTIYNRCSKVVQPNVFNASVADEKVVYLKQSWGLCSGVSEDCSLALYYFFCP
jgi:hypothetical protein